MKIPLEGLQIRQESIQWSILFERQNYVFEGLASSVIIMMNLFEQWSVNTNRDECNFSCTLYFVSNFWCISDITSFSNFIEIP